MSVAGGRLIRWLGQPAMRSLATSWQIRRHHHDRWKSFTDAGDPYVFVLWHETLLPLLWAHRGHDIAMVVSEGKEGKLLSDFATRIGYRMLPGSSTRGGSRALLGAIRALDRGSAVAFTPDGPVGPRRLIKPGAVRAAQRTGACIVPLHATVRSAWRLNSWDRLVVPRPFARVEVGYGEPFRIAPGECLGTGIARCSQALVDLDHELAA